LKRKPAPHSSWSLHSAETTITRHTSSSFLQVRIGVGLAAEMSKTNRFKELDAVLVSKSLPFRCWYSLYSNNRVIQKGKAMNIRMMTIRRALVYHMKLHSLQSQKKIHFSS